jgi:carbonic anhydrase
MGIMRTNRTAVPLLVLPLTLAVLVGCAAASPPETTAHDADAAWAYEGEGAPAHWGDLAGEYRACASGEQQSPIDLPEPRGGAALDLVGPGPVRGITADNGHTVQFTADDGATTAIAGADLDLVQVHFHAGSEHTTAGEASAAEFHFVHVDERGALTVVGVLAERGAHNPAYDDLVAGATAGVGRASTVDVEAMLPAARAFATYQGSLTIPPCTEGVRWIVLERAVELGADQLADLEAAHIGNARPVQPLGDRTVRHAL